MSQGRGNSMIVAILLLSFLAVAQAATYTVGGAGGWTFNVVNWPKGKKFSDGDTLVFKYNPEYHDVVVVDKGSYQDCTTPPGAKVYRTGNDQIKLVKGDNYFICNSPGHCENDMKIEITAE